MKPHLFALALALLPVSSAAYADTTPPSASTRPTRLVPSIRNGVVRGLKVYAIQPGSPYARAGFEAGDTILAIDGRTVVGGTDPDPLVAALRAARGRPVSIALDRKGRPMRLTVR